MYDGCRLVEDTAWHPVSKEELLQWKGTFKGWLFKTFLGSPLKSWASVGHWLIWHFDTTKYSDKQQNRVSMSTQKFSFSETWPACLVLVSDLSPREQLVVHDDSFHG